MRIFSAGMLIRMTMREGEILVCSDNNTSVVNLQYNVIINQYRSLCAISLAL